MASITAAGFVEALNADDISQVQQGLDHFIRACSGHRRDKPLGNKHGGRKRKRLDAGDSAADVSDRLEEEAIRTIIHEYVRSSPHCAELFRLWDEQITGGSLVKGLDAKQSHQLFIKVVQALSIVLAHVDEEEFQSTRVVVVKKLLQNKMRSLYSAMTSSEDNSTARHIVTLFTAIVRQGAAFARELSQKLSFSSATFLGPLVRSIRGKRATSKALFDAYLSFALSLLHVANGPILKSLLKSDGLLAILIAQANESLSASRTCVMLDTLRVEVLKKESISMMNKMDLFAQRKVIIGGVVECLQSNNEGLRVAAKTLLEAFTVDDTELRQLRRIRSIVAAALTPTTDPVQLELLVAVLESDAQVKATYMRSAWKLTLDPRPSFQWLRNITVAIRLLGTKPKMGKVGGLALPPEESLPKALLSKGIQHENKLVVLHSIDMAIVILAHCKEAFLEEKPMDVARLRMEIVARMPDANVVRAARKKWVEDEWILHRATRLLHWYHQVIPLALAGRVDFTKLFAQMTFDPAKPTSCATAYILLQLLDESSLSGSTAHLPKLLNVYRGLPDKRWRRSARRVFRSAVRHMILWEDHLITDTCLDLVQCETQEVFLMEALQVLKAKAAPCSSIDVASVLLKRASRPEEVTFTAHVALYAFLAADEEERSHMRSCASANQSLNLIALAEALMSGVEAPKLAITDNVNGTLETQLLTRWNSVSPSLGKIITSRNMDVSESARYCALLSHVAGSWIEREVPASELDEVFQVLITAASQFASSEIAQACLQHSAFTNADMFSSKKESVVQGICSIMSTIPPCDLPRLQGVVSAAKGAFIAALSSTPTNNDELDVCTFAVYSLSGWLSSAARCSLAKAIAKRLSASPGDSVVCLLKLWLNDLMNTHDLVAESFETARAFDTEDHQELLYQVIEAHANGCNRSGGLRTYLRANAEQKGSVSWLWTSLEEAQSWKGQVVLLLAKKCPSIKAQVEEHFLQRLAAGDEARVRALLNVYVVCATHVEPNQSLQPLAHYLCEKTLSQSRCKHEAEVATFIRQVGKPTTVSQVVDEFVQEANTKVLPLAVMQTWLDLDMSLRTDNDRAGRFLARYWTSAFSAKDFADEGFEGLRRSVKEFTMSKAQQKGAFKVGLRKLRRNLSAQVVEAMRLLVENSSHEVVKSHAHHIQVALVSHAEFMDLPSSLSELLTREALLLLLSITKRSPDKCCSRAIFLMLQSFYYATLSETDVLLHQILACYAEFDCVFAPANFGYLYGQHVQPDLFDGEVQGTHPGDEDDVEEAEDSTPSSVTRLINARYLPLLEGLSAAKMKRTVESFPCWRTRQDTSLPTEPAREDLYDVAFLIPLLDHLLSMFQYTSLAEDSEDTELLSPCREIVSVGGLSLLFKGLSSACQEIRRSSAAALRRFGQLASSATLFRERLQMIVLLRNIRYGIDSTEERLSGLVSSFLAQAAYLMLHPTHALYPLVNSFLLKRPNMDVKDVPMFYELFNTGEEGTTGSVSRTWILEVLIQGVHSKEDLHILSRRYVLSSVVAFIGNPLCSVKEKQLALQLLQRVAEIKPEGAIALISIGIFSWLASLSTCPGLPRTIDAILIPLLQLCTTIVTVSGKLNSRSGLDKQISIAVSAVLTAMRQLEGDSLEQALPYVLTFMATACGLDTKEGGEEILWEHYAKRPSGHKVAVSLEDLNWLLTRVKLRQSTCLDKSLFVLLHCKIQKGMQVEQLDNVLLLAFEATLGNRENDESQRIRVNLLQNWLKKMEYPGALARGPLEGAFNTLMLTHSD